MKQSSFVLSAATSLAFCTPVASWGQATAGQSAPETGTAQNDTAIEDIVVVATRREQRLQDVPIAVTAIGGAQLEQQGIATTASLTQVVPSLNFRRVNLLAQPIIRGVGSRGSSPGDESNVPIYLDGVYLAEASAAIFDLLNVERVETLRGPQGTLFGRNATGGLINVITTKPSHEFSGRLQARYGRFNERTIAGYVTAGLANGVAFDIAAQYSADDGYIRDLTTGGIVGERETKSIRARLLFEPSPIAQFILAGFYYKAVDPSSVYVQPYLGNTGARRLDRAPNTVFSTEPWQVAETFPQVATFETRLGSLESHIDLGAVKLENTTSYSDVRPFGAFDQDGTPFDLGRVDIFLGNGNRTRTFQSELRLLSNSTGSFSWIAGAYYLDNRSGTAPVRSCAVSTCPFATTVLIDAATRTHSYAGFAEGTLNVGENWHLIAGARYTSENRSLTGQTTRGGVVLSAFDGSKNFEKLTYRAIVQHDFASFGQLYASYSRGFKSGVYNSLSTSATSVPTRPEILDAFELGIKSDPAPWLRFNGAIFYYDYKDIQLSARDPGTGLTVLFNAANARVKGAEFEITLRPAARFNIRMFGSYLDAKYTNFPAAQIFTTLYQDQTSIGGSALTPIGNATSIANVSGSRMIRAPEFSGGVSADYTIPTTSGEFGVSANLFHSSRYYWEVNNRLFQPAYELLGGELSWTAPNAKYRATIWGRNLTNTAVQSQINPSATFDGVSYDRPRSYGVSLEVRF